MVRFLPSRVCVVLRLSKDWSYTLRSLPAWFQTMGCFAKVPWNAWFISDTNLGCSQCRVFSKAVADDVKPFERFLTELGTRQSVSWQEIQIGEPVGSFFPLKWPFFWARGILRVETVISDSQNWIERACTANTVALSSWISFPPATLLSPPCMFCRSLGFRPSVAGALCARQDYAGAANTKSQATDC